METMNYSHIYIHSIKFYPRSKSYDVVWRSMNSDTYTFNIPESFLLNFIEDEALHHGYNYDNIHYIDPMQVLEMDEGDTIKAYLAKYHKDFL